MSLDVVKDKENDQKHVGKKGIKISIESKQNEIKLF